MRTAARIFWASLALGLAFPAAAQDGQRGIRIVPEEDLVEQLAPEKSIDKTVVLPPAPPAPATRTLVDLPRIEVRRVVVDQGSIITDREVETTAAAFTDRAVTIEELEELRRRLSLLYFDKGYVNSGVVLPDQQVVDGIVHFREIRGELTEIRLSGTDNLREGYVLARIATPDDRGLEINALQTSLQLLEQDPMIRRINAQLLPGAVPGQGILRLDVAENRPWEVVVAADNHRSPAVGGEQASVLLRHRSLTGRGDELMLYGSYGDGYGDAYASFALPFNAGDTTLQIYGSQSDSDIVEEPFDDIDIESETTAYGLSLTQTLHRSLTGAVSVYAGIEIKHNENTLLGQPFSFTAGEVAGEADLTVAYGGMEFATRRDSSVTAVRVGLRRGLHRAGATRRAPAVTGIRDFPGAQFTSLLIQGQHLHDIAWRDSLLIGRITVQRAFDPLFSMEKLPVGGSSTVRGYRENLLVRDNGLIASLEWQAPLFERRASTASFDPRRLRLALFYDYGRSWNNTWENGPGTEREVISSAGLGFLWNPREDLSAEIYWGHDLRDVATGGDDIQDDGLHFRFRWTPGNR